MPAFNHIGVVGAGAWGTALALVAKRAGAEVTLWAREQAVIDEIIAHRENRTFLPGCALDPGLKMVADFGALSAAEALFLVVPAQHMRKVMADLARHIKPDIPILICAKGIEQGSNCLMSEVVAALVPDQPVAVLSGPTFAAEIAAGKPAAAMIAGTDPVVTRRFADSLADGRFRPYIGIDVRGAQIGGAVKNVLAIGSGIVMGRNLGENAQAAFVTRGLAEMTRFGVAYGGQSATLTGLAGLGDLCLTCSSGQSRNTALGLALSRDQDIQTFRQKGGPLAEGMWTAAAVADMALQAGVSMPICQAIDAILNHGADIDQAIEVLLARPLTDES